MPSSALLVEILPCNHPLLDMALLSLSRATGTAPHASPTAPRDGSDRVYCPAGVAVACVRENRDVAIIRFEDMYLLLPL